MSLKFKCKSKDEIPADHLPLYAEREGAWVLDVEGAVDKAKLDEFRTTNVALLKERDELKQRLEEDRQLKAGEVEKVIEARSKALKADFDKQHSTIVAERDALNARLAAVQIDQAAVAADTDEAEPDRRDGVVGGVRKPRQERGGGGEAGGREELTAGGLAQFHGCQVNAGSTWRWWVWGCLSTIRGRRSARRTAPA